MSQHLVRVWNFKSSDYLMRTIFLWRAIVEQILNSRRDAWYYRDIFIESEQKSDMRVISILAVRDWHLCDGNMQRLGT